MGFYFLFVRLCPIANFVVLGQVDGLARRDGFDPLFFRPQVGLLAARLPKIEELVFKTRGLRGLRLLVDRGFGGHRFGHGRSALAVENLVDRLEVAHDRLKIDRYFSAGRDKGRLKGAVRVVLEIS